MNQLVLLKKQNKEDVPVTTSKVIADRTKNTHDSVQKLIRNHIESLEIFGKVGFEIRASEKNQQEKNYFLNEQQATLLVTFMRNNETVIDFKIELVNQFYQMRQILQEKATQEWQEARRVGKTYQVELNDTIKNFVEYATKQGSSKPSMYYKHFASFSNKSVDIKDGERDFAKSRALQVQSFVIDLIKRTIEQEIVKGTNYKDIYKQCQLTVYGLLSYIMPKQIGA